MARSAVKLVSSPALDARTSTTVNITAPKIRTAEFKLQGTSPYMQARFSQKAMEKMKTKHEAGSQANSKKNREARNFDEDYENATHFAVEGWPGIPAGAFRTAMIDVCRLVNFKMTLAKLSVFIEPDGFDKVDGTPLVKIEGKREKNVSAVRNDSGVCDLRSRPMWRNWSVKLRVRFDEDQFSLADITNLLSRVGVQCGIGEGRPNSRASTGVGFGTFKLG